jgi:hypothetical protein
MQRWPYPFWHYRDYAKMEKFNSLREMKIIESKETRMHTF